MPGSDTGMSAGMSAGLSPSASGDRPAPRGSWAMELPAGLGVPSIAQAAWCALMNTRVPRLRRVLATVTYEPPPDGEPRDPGDLGRVITGPLVAALIRAGVAARPEDTLVSAEISARTYPRGRIRLVITGAGAR